MRFTSRPLKILAKVLYFAALTVGILWAVFVFADFVADIVCEVNGGCSTASVSPGALTKLAHQVAGFLK